MRSRTCRAVGSEVFELLGTMPHEAAVDTLTQALPVWERYSMMALSAAPEGAGISAIVDHLQAPGTDKALTQFGWELLAQVAPSDSSARDYLLAAAEADEIPSEFWEGISLHAAGTVNHQMRRPEREDPEVREVFTSHRFSKNGGNQGEQILYKWRPRRHESSEQVKARQELIDALAGATSDTQAQTALRSLLVPGQR